MKKLSLNQIYFISEVILFPVVLFGTYFVLGAERSYSVLVDIMPYGSAYVVGLIYQSEYELKQLSLYPISRIERMVRRIKKICFALLASLITYVMCANLLHFFNLIDAEILVVSLLILFMLLEVFSYQMKSSKKLMAISIVLYFIVIGLGVITTDVLQLTIIALLVSVFCIFWMYRQSSNKNVSSLKAL